MGGGSVYDNGPMLGPYRQIILFGDSITELAGNQQHVDDSGKLYFGFAFLPAVQNWLIRRFDVLNRGFSGYNTAAARAILPQFMPSPDQATISLIVIFFGANDSALKVDGPANQHVPLDKYKQNLRAIIHDPSIRNQNARVLLLTPPPIEEYMLDSSFLAGSRKADITKQYAEACCEVAKDENVKVLDVWTELMTKIGWNSSQPGLPGSKDVPQHPMLAAHFVDGLHLSERGYTFLYRIFEEKLKSTWPELEEVVDEEHDPVFPSWRAAMSSLSSGTEIIPRADRS